jgi:hypothetical protein
METMIAVIQENMLLKAKKYHKKWKERDMQ